MNTMMFSLISVVPLATGLWPRDMASSPGKPLATWPLPVIPSTLPTRGTLSGLAALPARGAQFLIFATCANGDGQLPSNAAQLSPTWCSGYLLRLARPRGARIESRCCPVLLGAARCCSVLLGAVRCALVRRLRFRLTALPPPCSAGTPVAVAAALFGFVAILLYVSAG